jgi:flagellar motor switch/type III secretory pathway protein FliN
MNTAASTSSTASLFYSDAEEIEPIDEIEPTIDEVEDDKPETAEEASEAETVEEDEETAELESDDDSQLYVALGEREVTVKQIKDWEKGSLMQSDYTKKTQALANDKREFQKDPDKYVESIVSKKMEGFDDAMATMEALIKETDDSIDWEDLKNYDSDEYIKQKELKEKRLEAISKAKNLRNVKTELSPEKVEMVQSELLRNNPNWLDSTGKQTEAHKADLKMLSEYLDASGYDTNETGQIVSAKAWQTLIDAARYRQSKAKEVQVKAKLKQIPITTKPRKSIETPVKSAAELFYGKSN